MPLGIGTVSWAGMSCPVAVGPSTVQVGVHMASILPAALAKADLALTALDQDGEAWSSMFGAAGRTDEWWCEIFHEPLTFCHTYEKRASTGVRAPASPSSNVYRPECR